MKVAWRQILQKWKKTDGRSLSCVPKGCFSRMLKLLMDQININSENNIRAGFRKTGPLNPNEVLARFPEEAQNDEEAKEAIDKSVLNLLKEIRYGSINIKEPKNKKKSMLFQVIMSGGPSRDRDKGRKWESGALKRKRKVEAIISNQALSSSMLKFLKKPSSSVTASESSDETLVSEQVSESNESFFGSSDTILPATSSELTMIQMSEPNIELQSKTLCDSENQVEGVHLRESFIYLDPGKWTFFKFADPSVSANLKKVYILQMVNEGCCDWKDLSRIYQRHEQSQGHMVCMIKWMEFYKGIKHGKTIDKDNERSIKESQKYWYNLFERMIDIKNYLASHNLAFRAHRESFKLNDSKNSGNFIDLFKLLSKYDLTLREHMQRINEKQLTQHYLSHDVQNELIALMSKSVIEEIIHRVKQAKYYAILLDCTRDVSRVEQMSIILRFCNSSTGVIEEHFVGFISIEKTGEYLTNSILQELERNGLDIQNCRGQGYNNGANVVGIHKG
ncbi:unnamed protein product [Parnassius apollo]|uniref:(apollo) hypothetical protein n=1 Tax=Parnassius apollo TaxID=110799 RepID=A0A8S3WJ12_PARAO|nr:unnamed protein product [Parnassius apollo]